jgi:hypothetical protein
MRFRPERLLDAIPLVFAVYVITQVLYTWALRVPHPYDLEWMEGGMLAHAWRLQGFESLYVEPGPDWIPMIYPPGYSAVVAAAGSVVGLDYWVARLISVFGTLGSAAAIMVLVGRHGKDWALGLFGAAIYLGCYEASGAFYDLVRPDALHIAFLAWSVVFAMEDRKGAAEASGLLLAVSFLMKHSAGAFGIPILLCFLFRGGWKEAARFAAASVIPALGFVGFMQFTSGGHFLTYLIDVPASHPMKWERGLVGVPRELASILPVAMSVSAAMLAVATARSFKALPPALSVGLPAFASVIAGWYGYMKPPVKGIPPSSDVENVVAFLSTGLSLYVACIGLVLFGGFALSAWFGLMERPDPTYRKARNTWVLGVGVAVCAIYMSITMRAHHGGFTNVLMQSHWAITLGFVALLAWYRRVSPGVLSMVVGVVAVGGQLYWQTTKLELTRLQPTADDVEAGDRFVEAIKRYDEPILSPFAPYLPAQAGKRPSFHLIALWDVAQHRNGPFFDQAKGINKAAREHHWNAVIDGTNPVKFGITGGPNAAYKNAEVIQPRGKAFTPKTGWRTRPKAIVIPK